MLWLCGFAVLGVLIRFHLSNLNLAAGFPVGTLLANFLGCLLLGYLSTSKLPIGNEMKIFIMVGLLGALTTFSGFAYEVVRLIEGQKMLLACLYFVLMNAGCLLLVFIGRKISHLI